MKNSDTRTVANSLFFRLFQTGNVLQKQVQREMGISTVQWAVLGALSRERYAGGISFFELTEYLVVSRQSLDGVLKRMERDNHVLRVPHPDDGRARLVQLTDNGRAFWNSLQERIQIFYQQALKGLSFDDSVSLLHFINKLQSDMAAISLGNEQQDDEAQ